MHLPRDNNKGCILTSWLPHPCHSYTAPKSAIRISHLPEKWRLCFIETFFRFFSKFSWKPIKLLFHCRIARLSSLTVDWDLIFQSLLQFRGVLIFVPVCISQKIFNFLEFFSLHAFKKSNNNFQHYGSQKNGRNSHSFFLKLFHISIIICS